MEKVLIVEELDPYIEEQVRIIANMEGLKVEIHGKDYIPEVGELTPTILYNVFAKFLGLDISTVEHKVESPKVPKRPPPLCPGSPHRASYYAIKRAISTSKLKVSQVPIWGILDVML